MEIKQSLAYCSQAKKTAIPGQNLRRTLFSKVRASKRRNPRLYPALLTSHFTSTSAFPSFYTFSLLVHKGTPWLNSSALSLESITLAVIGAPTQLSLSLSLGPSVYTHHIYKYKNKLPTSISLSCETFFPPLYTCSPRAHLERVLSFFSSPPYIFCARSLHSLL